MKLDAESYLQSGSNELRVLEYTSCGHSFGINILKVQKIISHPECLTSGINTHPSVIGIFKDNNIVIPLVDLGHFLGFGKAESLENKKVVVTEFFNVLNAFLVDSVEWIHHFVWEDVINANDVMKTINQKYVISIVKPDGQRMVPLLDYETMILDLCPELGYKEMQKISSQEFNGQGYRILIAEDSPSVRNMLVAELLELGFEVVSACDGREAVDVLEKDKNFNLVISDVEMPRMDGLALTTAIRTNPEIENMPVIVYSSIGDIGMKARAEFLKASAHVTKLSVEELMANVIKFVSGGKIEIPGENEEVTETSISQDTGEGNISEDFVGDEQLDISEPAQSSFTETVEEAEMETLSAETALAIIEESSGKKEDGNETWNSVPGTAEVEAERKQTISNEEIAAMIAEEAAGRQVTEEAEPKGSTLPDSTDIAAESNLEDRPEIILEAGRITVASAESVVIVDANNVSIENSRESSKASVAKAPLKKKKTAARKKTAKKAKRA